MEFAGFQNLMSSLQMRAGFGEAANSFLLPHVMGCQSLLENFLQSESMVQSELKNAVVALPIESITRLVTSPYLCELLMINKENPAEPLKKHIIQALEAEVLLKNPTYQSVYQPAWTVDGDVVLDSRIKAEFPALQTSCGIRLNYQSYAHNTGKEGIGGYSHQVALKHKERIETAKSIVAQTSSSALDLIERFTLIIQFRINQSRPNVVNSSTHTSIGLIRCDNFHKLHVDLPEVVDMLVHESIHQYLHLFEEQVMPFVDVPRIPDGILDVRAYPSPWSGAPLDFRSYTHAILVWYGLWHFWRQVADSGFTSLELSTDQIQGKIQEAALGFLKSESVVANLGDARQWLQEGYQSQVEQLQHEIKSYYQARIEHSA